MNEIDLRHFDLNLLVVFDVLMTERSVTRAAERLGRTQSAVSHSLSRLREQFGDPLLIKGGARMQPTALALALIEQARPMLGGIQRVLSPQHVFDPTTSTRVFRLAAPDFMLTLFADLMTRLRTEAPWVAVEWTAPREPTLLDVAEGLIDIAIVPAELRWPTGVTGEAVGAWDGAASGERGMRRFGTGGGPRGRIGRISMVRVGDSLTSPVDVAAAAAGLERTIAGWVPNFCRGCTRAGRVRSAVDLADGCDERDGSRLQAGEQGRAVSASAAAACNGLVQRTKPGSRPDLAARSVAPDRQT